MCLAAGSVSGIKTHSPITLQGLPRLGGPRALGLHPFCFCNSFLPPIGHSFPRPFQEALPLSSPGPLGPACLPGPHPFPVPLLNSAPTWVESFSPRDGRLLLLPSRPARKARGEWVGWLGLASSQRGEVTRPQSHNRETTPSQLGPMGRQLASGMRLRTRPQPNPLPTRVSGATRWRSAGQHPSESPLSSRPEPSSQNTIQC